MPFLTKILSLKPSFTSERNSLWIAFDTFLGYKLHWLGGWLGTVSAPYTSQTCPVPECGHVSQANRSRQTTFRCKRCGYEGHADTVGAMNTLRAGLARIACSPV
ncbi:zinc ribbon domain-containing protein [Methylacidiphilum caldifontis]|uniref:zinc ribbon domain-containing protein n=1 Tax=Methylacidiphilum caldifontis TaxID=2795386 RepID=UPI0034CFD128